MKLSVWAKEQGVSYSTAWRWWKAGRLPNNLIERSVERELIPMAKALNLGLVAWSPLSGGVLTGKYNDGQAAGDARYASDMMRQFLPVRERQERSWPPCGKVSTETGRSLAQVALAWLRYREIPVIPIIGARKLPQFADNLASLSLMLTREQMKAFDKASQIKLGFPHDFYRREIVRTFVYGGMRDQISA